MSISISRHDKGLYPLPMFVTEILPVCEYFGVRFIACTQNISKIEESGITILTHVPVKMLRWLFWDWISKSQIEKIQDEIAQFKEENKTNED